ncbi:MAG: AraC family transcriptional regulator, partial [Pseudomonadota bacterium]
MFGYRQRWRTHLAGEEDTMSSALAVSHGGFGRAAIYAHDRPMITHAHREGHLIFRISGAPATVKVGSVSVDCDGSMAAAVSPWEPHSFSFQEDAPCVTLVLYIKPMWFLENSGSADYALNFGTCRVPLSGDLPSLVRKLTALMLEDSGDINVETILIELAKRCYEVSWKDRQRPCSAIHRRRFSDFRVRRSQELMKSYLSCHNGLDALAQEVGLSRPHFFKLFKKQTGVTPNIYFNTLRAEQAIEDLTASRKSVTDIAYDLGFASQASFTRFFSQNVGIAPSDYRRTAQTISHRDLAT